MNNFFNRLIFMILLTFSVNFISAQGLQSVFVETYYVSTAADQTATGLPVGSTTYRLWVDMLPGYSLQAVYGNDVDSLSIRSTTPFYNNVAQGANTSNDVGDLTDGAAIVDSWFSFGGGGTNRRAILKSTDTNGTSTPLTNSGFHPTSGQLLSTHDGRFTTGNALAAAFAIPGYVDMTVAPYNTFNNATVSNKFSTVAVPDGITIFAGGTAATGVVPADNMVLIGQFTTTGAFGYRVNLQLGTPTPGVSETYLANTPAHAALGLVLIPNTPPTVAITTPAANISVVAGTTVNVVATATDTAPGTITQVQFFNGATLLSTDTSSPYEYSFTAATTVNLTAVATDNEGATSTSGVRTISVGANQSPVIVVAATPSTVVATAPVTLTAPTLTDADGTVVSVQYYYRTTPAGTGIAIGALLTGAPFSTVWNTPNVAGTYYVYAIATDNLGASTTASNVSVIVNANTPPAITIAIPTALPITAPALVTINATATDADGTITNVKFFVNNVLVGSDNTGPNPYTFDWTSTPGFKNFTARAFDNNGDSITSNLITIEIIDPAGAPYRVGNVTQTCIPETFCAPIISAVALDNVIGYDVIINYNAAKVEPTGNIIVRNLYVDSTLVEVVNSIEASNSRMNFSAYFKANAPAGTEFNGAANQQVFCVEFAKLATFASVDTVTFTVTKLQESYANGILLKSVDPGKYITYRDSLFDSSLKFWADNSPIAYTAGTNLITNIYGTDAGCSNKALVGVTPDANGNFVHNINKGRSISIERDIAGSTSVQPVVNGADALLVRRLLINDVSLRPNVYQIIAMDVNLDGVVSAGDASQINQRSVLILPEYKQAWNYNAGGTPIAPAQLSKDWLFIHNSITSTAAFGISTTFPNDNGIGYSKQRVPSIAFCNPTPVSDFATCPVIGDEIYKGILLGDVNGSYRNIAPSVTLRTNNQITFDLGQAVINDDNTIDVPVYVSSNDKVNALDFALNFNEDKITFNNVSLENAANIQALSHLNNSDRTLRFTSNSLVDFNSNQKIASVRFNLLNNDGVSIEDFLAAEGYINGEKVNTEVINRISGDVKDSNINVLVYPNPTSGILNINPSSDATAQLFDLSSKQVSTVFNVLANQNNEVNVEHLNTGVYMVKIYNETYVITKKIFVTK